MDPKACPPWPQGARARRVGARPIDPRPADLPLRSPGPPVTGLRAKGRSVPRMRPDAPPPRPAGRGALRPGDDGLPGLPSPPTMASKRFKAAVIGGSGYGGAELVRRLLVHPDVELVRVASIDFVGESLSAVHPTPEGR